MKTWNTIKPELLRDPVVRAEYERLAPRFEIISLIIEARLAEGLTQSELAQRVGTKQAAIARLESGNYNPSVDFLQRVAMALGKQMTISFK